MRFVFFLSVVLGIWLLEHLYVGWRLSSLPLFAAPKARQGLLVGLAVAFVSYPLGRWLFHLGWQETGRVLEYLGALWMGALFFLLAAFLVVDALTLFGLIIRPWVPVLRSAAVVVALGAAATAWVGGLMPPQTVELEVEMPGLRAGADGLVVTHLSDLHLGTLIGERRLRTVIERIDATQPDLVAITGDLVDGDAGVVEALLPRLRTLRAPLGVFAVLGNHEYYAGAERSRTLLTDAGFAVLDNAAIQVAPGLWVAGVPDGRGSAQTGEREDDLREALAGVGDGDAIVLLQHSPENEGEVAASGVGLMLDGHTHGGQIWPFHYLVRRAFTHMAGVHRVGSMTQVVSRGAGQWGPPMRLFARSEILRITLRTPAVAAIGASDEPSGSAEERESS